MDDAISAPLPKPAETQDTSSRRAFVKTVTGGMCLAYAAAIGYPVYRYLNSPVEKAAALANVHDITLKDADKLPAGSVMLFMFGPFPAMLIHHQNNEWVAFSAVCTHLGCTVQYHTDDQLIKCACHGGVYDSHTGANISGPPPKPLTQFAVKVGTGEVTVSRV